MKYLNILKQSWIITWKNKYLWFFGLFAALLGNGGDLDIIVRGFDKNNTFLSLGFSWLSETGIFTKNIFSNFLLLFKENPGSLMISLFIMLLMIVMIAFLFWLIIISQIGIVNNSVKIITNKNHNIKSAVEKGREKFWEIFTLNVFLKIFILMIFYLLLSTLFIKESLLQSTLYIVLFIVSLILIVVASFITKYAICFVIIKGFNITNAVKSGWDLFIKNWLVSLEMAFLLFVLNFLVIFLLYPLFFLFLIFSKIVLYFGVWFLFISSAILFLLIIALIGSILSTFQISSWTSLFVELISRGGVSKIMRIFGKK